MGRATVVSGGDAGLYTVSLDYGSEIVSAQVTQIDQQIADRQADLAEAEAALSAADSALNEAQVAVDNAIDAYAAAPTDENRAAMNAAATTFTRVAAERRVAKAKRDSIKTIILSLQGDKSQLESVRTSETRQAWCVDYTEDATGEVATIEVPGEVGIMVIAPGGRPPAANDGRLIARGAQAPHQVYYNAAILPGWQRFVHGYRNGTLTAKDGDTGTVSLDAATSSANGLQVRDAETISAPIQYMTCNGSVFEVGDRVIVDMDGPTIIGFESEPRQCIDALIFEVELFPESGSGAQFSASDSVVGTCPGLSTRTWAFDRRYYLRQRLYDGTETPFDLVTATVCQFDADAANYEGACVTDYFGMDGAIDIVEGSLQWFEVEYQDGLDNSNVMGGRTVTGTLESSTTALGVSVFSQLTVDYFNLATGSLVRESEESTVVDACLIPDSQAAQYQFTLTTADLPNFSYSGKSYQPVGMVRVIESPDPQRIQDPKNFRIKVLAQRV